MTPSNVTVTATKPIKWDHETLDLASMTTKELDAQLDEIYHRLGWSLTHLLKL